MTAHDQLTAEFIKRVWEELKPVAIEPSRFNLPKELDKLLQKQSFRWLVANMLAETLKLACEEES